MNNIITPAFRVAFPNVFKPKVWEKTNTSEYAITMIFDKEADLKPLKDALMALAKEKWPKRDFKTNPLQLPIKKGEDILNKDGEPYDMFIGKTVITAKSKKRRPEVIDALKNPILEEADLYAGCYARASILPYAYTMQGGGIGFGLQNIQKLREGEPFMNIKSAHDDFEAISVSEDSSAPVEESAFEGLM